jgi:hypothetical protein
MSTDSGAGDPQLVPCSRGSSPAGTGRHAAADDVRPIPVHCDWMLSEDCQRLGFVQAMDLSVICGHIRPEGPRGVIWPDVTMPECYRIDPLAG